ncbi:hypothetical protein [uncultured Polaribacter sp.]|uniref:hypothetical protein n=1 Tax=uncultured Polaribacter sp. TaxID=174711 RepID=UPI00262477C1|nr:hypothetical protein [uncultured Polaribacter sp.]
MKGYRFITYNDYLCIPSRKNPKVILAIGSALQAKNSFQLYNPFSVKAKLLKRVLFFLSVNFNSIAKIIFSKKAIDKDKIVSFLEEKYQTEFISSIYNSTAGDKVIVQLQSENKIFGYVKYPLNERGKMFVENERKGIEILSHHKVIDTTVDSFIFNKTTFIVLPEIKGKVGFVDDLTAEKIIEPYKKEKKFLLIKHKRVQSILQELTELGFNKYVNLLNKITKSSNELYFEAFEHGDYTPWNILKSEEKYQTFDFEFFVENGLEYLDLIKFHYQVGKLLEKNGPEDLIKYLLSKIQIVEIKLLVSIFLLKEIVLRKMHSEDYAFEEKTLQIINE